MGIKLGFMGQTVSSPKHTVGTYYMAADSWHLLVIEELQITYLLMHTSTRSHSEQIIA